MIPSAAMWNEFAVKVGFIATEAHCWFVSRQAHLSERRSTILLFHDTDPTVIRWLDEQTGHEGGKERDWFSESGPVFSVLPCAVMLHTTNQTAPLSRCLVCAPQ